MTDKTAPTPGPWSAQRAKYPVDGEFDYCIGAMVNGQTKCIAEAFGRVSVDGRPNAEANARLIAAAPDLLAALASAESFISGFEGDEIQEGVDELLAAVRAAIAKATKETT